jgi:uncharacterized protein (DUF1499 family)
MRGAGERRSWLALAAAVVGVLAVLDALLGPGLAHYSVIEPSAGYGLFLLGAAEAALAIFVALLAFARTGVRSRRTGRGLAWVGLLGGALVLGVAAAHASAGRGLPRIYDVTTNPDDPPAFVTALSDPGNAGSDLAYPPGATSQQRTAYPDLTTIAVDAAPAETLERARLAALGIGLDVVDVRAPSAPAHEGVLEARQRSQVFRFVDDVVIRVRPSENGSVVDVRSRSRNATADFGVNARRIRAFKNALLNEKPQEAS